LVSKDVGGNALWMGNFSGGRTMTADQKIRDAFSDAEKAVPETKLKVSVIREAFESHKDDDERQYEYIYERLAKPKRSALACDMNAWLYLHKVANELLNMAQVCLLNAEGDTPGPLLSRLQRPVIRSPKNWRVCGICNGTGEDPMIAHCNGCGGHGYYA
jgi:hypothetical protein